MVEASSRHPAFYWRSAVNWTNIKQTIRDLAADKWNWVILAAVVLLLWVLL